MNLKRRIVFLIASLSLFFLLIYTYNLVSLKKSYIEAYMLQEDFTRGSLLNMEKLSKVYLKKDSSIIAQNYILDDNLEKYVVKKDITKGKLLVDEDVMLESKYKKISDNYELISIKIANPENVVSYQIEKDSIVNLYYTGKSELASNILSDVKAPYINTSKDSNTFDNGFITVKLAENIKVIDLYDKFGNSVKEKDAIKNELNKIDTIMFELNKDIVMKVNNLKNYGEFSVSIVK